MFYLLAAEQEEEDVAKTLKDFLGTWWSIEFGVARMQSRTDSTAGAAESRMVVIDTIAKLCPKELTVTDDQAEELKKEITLLAFSQPRDDKTAWTPFWHESQSAIKALVQKITSWNTPAGPY